MISSLEVQEVANDQFIRGTNAAIFDLLFPQDCSRKLLMFSSLEVQMQQYLTCYFPRPQQEVANVQFIRGTNVAIFDLLFPQDCSRKLLMFSSLEVQMQQYLTCYFPRPQQEVANVQFIRGTNVAIFDLLFPPDCSRKLLMISSLEVQM